MSERSEHLFGFPAHKIAQAAREEADYHAKRAAHWAARRDRALDTVKAAASVKVVEHEVSGGHMVRLEVDYGDPAAWREFELASAKLKSHLAARERHASDARLYGSQGEQLYKLDADDVFHFRMDGRERED